MPARVLPPLLAFMILALPVHAADGDEFVPRRVAVVVKKDGLAWFERMRQGVDAFVGATGHEAFLTGPADADPDAQIAVIEDMLTDQVDALCLVPVDPAACEAILARARQDGVKVVAHDADGLVNCDMLLEPFPDAHGDGAFDPLTSADIDWENVSPGEGVPASKLYDPAAIGYAMLVAAVRLIEGETVGEGTDLGIRGYQSLRSDPNHPTLFYGEVRSRTDGAGQNF